jgi:hypothetical protein
LSVPLFFSEMSTLVHEFEDNIYSFNQMFWFSSIIIGMLDFLNTPLFMVCAVRSLWMTKKMRMKLCLWRCLGSWTGTVTFFICWIKLCKILFYTLTSSMFHSLRTFVDSMRPVRLFEQLTTWRNSAIWLSPTFLRLPTYRGMSNINTMFTRHQCNSLHCS